jgi:putative aminopeptidase FrvX
VIIVAEKETKSVEKKASKKKEPVRYIHIDEFFANREEKLSQGIKNGFSVFMRGQTYQLSHENFEKKLKEFMKRKI